MGGVILTSDIAARQDHTALSYTNSFTLKETTYLALSLRSTVLLSPILCVHV